MATAGVVVRVGQTAIPAKQAFHLQAKMVREDLLAAVVAAMVSISMLPEHTIKAMAAPDAFAS
jgi:hypothetical protein